MATNDLGWFGWFSVAGFVIMGSLYLLDTFVADIWNVSMAWTLGIALLAGIGAAALWAGNDPTNDGQRRQRTTG